jgi:hypothetical protein
MKSIFHIPLVVVLASCSSSSGQPVDLGDDNIESAGQTLASYEGAWDGYMEAFELPSGSDRLRILLDSSGQGSVEFGDVPAITPFSDPSRGYPEDEPFDTQAFTPNYAAPREGFVYPVHDAAVSDGRIELVVWGSDIVSDFCAAQSQIRQTLSTPSSYTCSPTGDGYGQGDEGCVDASPDSSTFGMSFDCGLIKTCLAGCVCDETSCTSVRHPGRELVLDGSLAMDGTQLVGTLVLQGVDNGGRVTVRLTKL